MLGEVMPGFYTVNLSSHSHTVNVELFGLKEFIE